MLQQTNMSTRVSAFFAKQPERDSANRQIVGKNGAQSSARLGVDIGGVVIQRREVGERGGNVRDRAMPGAFEVLAALASHFAAIYLVSKAGPVGEARTRAWLQAVGFARLTGIDASRWRFVRERAHKAAVAAELGLTHFVDDRLEVLGALDPAIRRFLFRSSERGYERDAPLELVRRQVVVVRSWPELRDKLLSL